MPTETKRKTIDQFFEAATGKDSKRSKLQGSKEKSQKHFAIPGLGLLPDYITQQEEVELLAFLDNQTWRSDLVRRVIHFGGTYCLMAPVSATAEERRTIQSQIITADPMPTALDFILERMILDGLYAGSEKPQYCIVNEYKDSQGISAHVENFRFISPICGLTLSNGDWIRFHELASPDDGSVRSGKAAKAIRTGKVVDVWMPQRSLLVMSGEARDRWQHEIVRSKRGRIGPSWRRVSLTFRAESKKFH